MAQASRLRVNRASRLVASPGLGAGRNCLRPVSTRAGVLRSACPRQATRVNRNIAFSEARASGLVEEVLVDGSFVGASPDPNDIDLVVVVRADHDFSADLPPSQYNVVAQKRVRKRFGLDIVVVKNGSENLDWVIAFFQQVKQRPGFKKGVLRIRL